MAATVKAGAKSRANGTRPKPQALPAAPAEPFRFSTEAEPEAEEREPFFYIDDDEYTILSNPGPGIAIEAMHIMAGGGPAAIVESDEYVMTEMLGEDGWAALRGVARDRRITGRQLRAMIIEVTQKAMGALEEEGPNR
jgi:hypothetical protein